jgi:hypothetical protein
MKVLRIPSELTYDFILNIHYAKRIPPITYAYGLYDENDLIGIVTYGTPSSATLKQGIAGKKYESIILELNRLVITKKIKNSASYLISNSIKMLPNPTIIVSYADLEMNHNGYVYQAANFIYTGLSAKRTDWKINGMEKLHGQTIADMSRGQENRAEYMRERFGDDFYLKERSRKHRYIFIHANKKDKKEIQSNLKYKVVSYPKGESKLYQIEKSISIQPNLFV